MGQLGLRVSSAHRSLRVGLQISLDYWWCTNVILRGVEEVCACVLASPSCACGVSMPGGSRDLPAPIPALSTCGQNSPRYLEVMSACHQRAADALVAGAISNGGLYVKLGQGLCSFNHLLPPEYIRTLRVLEDRALTRGFREVSPPPRVRGGQCGPMASHMLLKARASRWTSCSSKTSRLRPMSFSRSLTTSPLPQRAWPRCTVPGCTMVLRWP